MTKLDEQVRAALQSVEDAYDDFVNAIAGELAGKKEKQEALLEYLGEHPEARSNDIIEHIVDVICPEILDEQDYEYEEDILDDDSDE